MTYVNNHRLSRLLLWTTADMLSIEAFDLGIVSIQTTIEGTVGGLQTV